MWKMRHKHFRGWNIAGNTEILQNEKKKHCRTWNMGRNIEKCEKWEIQNLGPGICLKKLKNVENETQNLYDLEYVEKHWKTWKTRNTHCRTWIVARNLTWGKWKSHIIGPENTLRYTENRAKMENTHCRTWNMERKLTNKENENLPC